MVKAGVSGRNGVGFASHFTAEFSYDLAPLSHEGVAAQALLSHGCGLKPEQKSVLTIGMCTRNIGAAIAPLMAIKADSRSIVMVTLGIPVTLVFSFFAARWYASHAPQDEPGERSANGRVCG